MLQLSKSRLCSRQTFVVMFAVVYDDDHKNYVVTVVR